MKRFLVLYLAPAEVLAQMANATEEQKAEGMKPWMAWKERAGDAVVDFGSPLMGGHNIAPNSDWTASNNSNTGYSIIQAESLEAAKALLANHPHISWAPGCSIDLHESAPM